MNRNTRNISFKMFLESMRQVRVIGVVMAVALTVELISVMINLNQSHYSDAHWDYFELFTLVPFIGSVFVPVMFIILYGWINKRGESDFYHSLPIKRGTLAFIYAVTVAIWSLGLCFFNLFISKFCIELFVIKKVNIDYSNMLMLTIESFVVGLMFSGAFVLSMNLVKGRVMATILTIGIIFGPRMLTTFFHMIIETVMPSLYLEKNILWDNTYNIFYCLEEFLDRLVFDSFHSNHIEETLAYSTCLFVIYWVIAIILFIERKSEVAERDSYNGKVDFICKLLLPLGASMLGCFFIISSNFDKHSNFSDIIIMYMIVIGLYAVIMMVSNRSVKAILKLGPGLVTIFIINFVVIIGTISFIDYHKAQKPVASEIDYVVFESMTTDNYWREMNEADPLYGLQGVELEGDSIKKFAEDCIADQDGIGMRMYEHNIITVKYNGKKITRYFDYYGRNTMKQLLGAILEDEKGLENIDANRLPNDIEQNVYQIFRNEAVEMDKKIFAEEYLKEYIDGLGNDRYEGIRLTVEYKYETFDMYIPKCFEKTYEAIRLLHGGKLDDVKGITIEEHVTSSGREYGIYIETGLVNERY